MVPATTIDDVIRQLDEIIARAQRTGSCLGYFAVLYRKVTARVKEGIENGLFEDNERMAHLDVRFANRYLEAFRQYRDGESPTRSWQSAFTAATAWSPIVLQHLLLGMNAHINLDLGIAAAETVSPPALPGLHNDFNKINDILSSMIDEVQGELADVWPLLKLLDKIAGKTDELLINFSMNRARDQAWKVAEKLAPLSIDQRNIEIDRLDTKIEKIARGIRQPGFIIRLVLLIIRLSERGSVSRKIEILK